MKGPERPVPIALAPVELARGEGLGRGGIGDPLLDVRVGQRRELGQELAPPFGHGARQLGVVVGEVDERARRSELLSLEQHRRPRRQQQQRRHRAKLVRRGRACRAARRARSSRPGRGSRDRARSARRRDRGPAFRAAASAICSAALDRETPSGSPTAAPAASRDSRCSRPRCARSARPAPRGGSRRSRARRARSRLRSGGRTRRVSWGSFSDTSRSPAPWRPRAPGGRSPPGCGRRRRRTSAGWRRGEGRRGETRRSSSRRSR